MQILAEVVLDATLDTLKLVPFLFVTYLAMEALEGAAGGRALRVIEHAGPFGPVLGALLGVVPQCGFSAAAATLYAGRVVSVGTLLAVFLSTGDELLPVFLSEGASLSVLARILAVKALIAMALGLAVDVAARALHRAGDGHAHIHELCEREGCGCDDDHDHHGVLASAVRHTLQVTLFIFLVTLAIGAVIEVVGHDALGAFMAGNPVISVLAAGLVGLIPNCAASVVVAELFIEGTIGSAALLAGSLVSAGVGMLVLFRTNRGVGHNLAFAAGLYVAGVACGLVMLATGLSF